MSCWRTRKSSNYELEVDLGFAHTNGISESNVIGNHTSDPAVTVVGDGADTDGAGKVAKPVAAPVTIHGDVCRMEESPYRIMKVCHKYD